MSLTELLRRLEDAKRHLLNALNDLDEVGIPSGEKNGLAHRLDTICGDCDEVIGDVESLGQWMGSTH